MKTLILNGSPRAKGDTASLLKIFKESLSGEVTELSAYRGNFAPCNDCRRCKRLAGCSIKDDMAHIYADDYDNIIIASPVYMHSLTPPMMNIATRLQTFYCARRFRPDTSLPRLKAGGLILSAGGDGDASSAVKTAKLMFSLLNAKFTETDTVLAGNTDTVLAIDDEQAIASLKKLITSLNNQPEVY